MRWLRAALSMMIFLLLAVFLKGQAECSETRGNLYNIEKSVSEALENHWSIKAKKERIDEAIAVKEQAKASFYPKLSTSYGYTRVDDVRRSPSYTLPVRDPFNALSGTVTIPARDQNTLDNYQWKATLTQPLFTGFALTSSYELSLLGIQQREVELELEKLDLAMKVKEAYFNILRADKGIEVAGKAVESLESNVNVAQSFFEVGIIPINDLLKAEVELANSRQNLVKTINNAKYARSLFNILLSKSINDPVEVEDILDYLPVVESFEASLNQALERRPEIMVLNINLLQADKQIKLAKSKYYPEATFFCDYIKEGDHPWVSGSNYHDDNRWQAMAVLSWTFWEWGKTNAAVKEKNLFKMQLLEMRYGVMDNITLDVKKAYLDIDQTSKNIPTTKKALEQAEENLRVNEERYKAQVTTITEVLDAQTLLTQARINYYIALYDNHLAKARLIRAIGEY